MVSRGEDMVGLRVDWTLNAPMVYPDQPLHLDALVAWAACDAADLAGRSDPRGEQILAELPLASFTGDTGWCWCASRLRFGWDAPPWFSPWVRRAEAEVVAQTQGSAWIGNTDQLSMGTGPYRGYFGFDAIGWARYASAWCIGDPERIGALVARIRGLGRRRTSGHGHVESVSVVEDARAEQQWQDRVMPCPMPDYAPVIERLHPPYYSPDDRAVAYVPREPAVLDLVPTEEAC